VIFRLFEKKPAAVAQAAPTIVLNPVTNVVTYNGLEVSMPAKAVESNMSTAAVVPAAPNGFVRFIDKLRDFLKKAAPVADEVAEAAKPILALTPFGAEYNIALTAIETAAKADISIQSASATPLTGIQQLAIAIQVAQPELATILASKGVVEPTSVQTAISQFVQNVYNFQTGPVATVPPTAAAVVKAG
jgi:hypothetical protein